MTSSWDILGIAETSDTTAIKRAYIALVKLHNPQIDIEGFKRIREAYEQALVEAKYVDDDLYDDAGVASSEPEPELLPLSSDATDDSPALDLDDDRSSETFHNDVRKLIDDMSDILAVSARRRDVVEWRRLFEHPAMLDAEARMAVGAALFSRLNRLAEEGRATSQSLARMPADIWLLFDRTFDWSATEIDLVRSYPANWVNFVMTPILKATGKASKPSYARSMRRSSPGNRRTSWTDIALWIFGLVILISGAQLARLLFTSLFN